MEKILGLWRIWKRRYPIIINLVILLFGVILVGFSIFVIKVGPYYDFLLNLSAGFVGAALAFLFENVWARYDREEISRAEMEGWVNELGEKIQEMRLNSEAVDELLEMAKDRLQDTKVTSGYVEAFRELSRSVLESKETIDVVSWKDIEEELSIPASQQYIDATEKRLQMDTGIRFRWLLWNESHLDHAIHILKSSPVFSKVEVSYLHPTGSEKLPILPFVMVDGEQVHFGWGALSQTSLAQYNLQLTDPKALSAFQSYFDVLWREQGILLKEKGQQELQSDAIARVRHLIKQTKLLQVQNTRADALATLRDLYLESKKSIEIVSWKRLNIANEDADKKLYFTTLHKRATDKKNSQDFRYRRLLWMPEHLEYIQENIHEYNSISGAEIRYILPKQSENVPLLPLVLVDRSAINFGQGYLGAYGSEEMNITIKEPRVVYAFEQYFWHLWSQAEAHTVKKPFEPVSWQVISAIKRELENPT